MAKFIHYDYAQSKMLPVNFDEQILAGTFEHTVHYLVDNQLDLSLFESRYCNDDSGRPAYDPAILLKIVLVAYSRGVTSSRKIERLCRENIVFMALSADSQPHFTTIADFISRMSDVIQPLFLEVLMVCGQAGLIGQEMFAIDGCKLPSNASKEWSGTHADLTNKHKKIDRAVSRMLSKHREDDLHGNVDGDMRTKELKQIEKLKAVSLKVKKHLACTVDKIGSRGQPLKSNITDNDSAKMKTGHGVIQGYVGVAAVDNKHQIVIAAEAFGQAQEHDLLEPMINHVKTHLGSTYIEETKLTADAGFHNTHNVTHCVEQNVDAYIADNGFRKRDPRFADYARFKPKEPKQPKSFSHQDFSYNEATNECRCPAGKPMWLSMANTVMGDHRYHKFQAYLNDCRVCPLQAQCMRKPPTTNGRQVSIKIGDIKREEPNLLTQMKTKIDSRQGRHIYSERLGTVEPVFANINTAKKLSRFSLRGKPKVNAQWLMFCMVHNIEKIQRYGATSQITG